MQHDPDQAYDDGTGYDYDGVDDGNWDAEEPQDGQGGYDDQHYPAEHGGSYGPQDQHDDGYNEYDQGGDYAADDQYDNTQPAEDDVFSNLLYQIQDNDPSLTRASFFDFRIGDIGAEDVAAALEHGPNTCVTLLDCGQNEITDKGFEVLIPAIGASRIRHLWLRDNY